MLEESDTYLMILEQGEERATRRHIQLVGEERLGAAGIRSASNWRLLPTPSVWNECSERR